MITSITKFPLPAGIDLAEFRRSLREMAPAFRQPAGLLSKHFLISEDGRQAGGVYLWSSRADARAFEPVIRSMIAEKLGVEADISYFETPVIVDNRQNVIAHTEPVQAAAPSR